MTHKTVTLKDIAKVVGVHVSTVSRALDPNLRHLITPEVAEKVLRVSAEMKYRPNASAYGLRTKRTRTIGVVIPDITNPIFPPIIRGVEDRLAQQNYVTIIANTDNRAERDSTILESLLAHGVDGLIIASALRKDDAVVEISRGRTAIVTVNRRVAAKSVASVVNDDEGGIRSVVEHLVALGHRHIANIAGPQKSSTGRLRRKTFERAHRESDLPAGQMAIAFADSFNEAEGERCALALLDGGKPLTAIVCANDRLAIGALDALKRKGLKCPEDVSVTGYNDMPLMERLNPPLTTVRIQPYDVGWHAADIVLRLAVGETDRSDPPHEILPVELVVRSSTAPPPE